MEKPWQQDFDELDTEIMAVQCMADGSMMAPLAVALALIDNATIDKDRLLQIIESLHAILALVYEDRPGYIAEAELVLTGMREFLDGEDWSEGNVVQLLRKQENVGLLVLLLRQAAQKRGGQ